MDKFVQRKPSSNPHQDGSPRSGQYATPLEPPSKRVKREISDSDADSDGDVSDQPPLTAGFKSSAWNRQHTTDAAVSFNDDTPHQSEAEAESIPVRPTAMESALPELKTDKDAIEEYETFRASQGEQSESVATRFVQREWVKGKSSLYVDAFNLALSTVLEDESHLFDDKESSIFDDWEKLSYEAQYL